MGEKICIGLADDANGNTQDDAVDVKKQHRSTGRRFTVEQQQEYRSRAQLDDRLTEFGWLVNPKDRDLGEDVGVDVFDGGRSAGIGFVVQLKSTTSLAGLATRGAKTHISYRLAVKDLMHWEVSAQFVVVFIWDIHRRKGLWSPVTDIIRQLGSSRAWRGQSTVTVKLPLANTTTDISLRRLRRLVADHHLPIVRQGKTFDIQSRMVFPDTPKGRAAAEEFRRALDYGEPARVDGKYIKGWKQPDWWERLYGAYLPQSFTITSSKSDIEGPVRLEVDVPGRATHAVLLQLRRAKGGRRGATFTNEHEDGPAKLTLSVKREGDLSRVSMNLSVNQSLPDIFEARDAAQLLLALRTGTWMRVVQRKTAAMLVEGEVPAGDERLSTESLEEWIAFLDKLCAVQRKVHQHGRIEIRDGHVSRKEGQLVEDFHAICTNGFIERSMVVSATLGLAEGAAAHAILACARRGEPAAMDVQVLDAGTMQLLNVSVPLGTMRVRHDAAAFADQIEKALSRGHNSVKVRATVLVREEYPAWTPRIAVSSQVGR